MKFTPDYPVMYGGERRPAKVPFEIDDSDVEEMGQYGVVEETSREIFPNDPKDNNEPGTPAKKPGRPKKAE